MLTGITRYPCQNICRNESIFQDCDDPDHVLGYHNFILCINGEKILYMCTIILLYVQTEK